MSCPLDLLKMWGFRLMMSVCYPALNMPSRITITRDIYHLYVDERVKLKEISWTCMSKGMYNNRYMDFASEINYMCFTAHFIDNDWKLDKKKS